MDKVVARCPTWYTLMTLIPGMPASSDNAQSLISLPSLYSDSITGTFQMQGISSIISLPSSMEAVKTKYAEMVVRIEQHRANIEKKKSLNDEVVQMKIGEANQVTERFKSMADKANAKMREVRAAQDAIQETEKAHIKKLAKLNKAVEEKEREAERAKQRAENAGHEVKMKASELKLPLEMPPASPSKASIDKMFEELLPSQEGLVSLDDYRALPNFVALNNVVASHYGTRGGTDVLTCLFVGMLEKLDRREWIKYLTSKEVESNLDELIQEITKGVFNNMKRFSEEKIKAEAAQKGMDVDEDDAQDSFENTYQKNTEILQVRGNTMGKSLLSISKTN